jgi:hypothetical protein
MDATTPSLFAASTDPLSGRVRFAAHNGTQTSKASAIIAARGQGKTARAILHLAARAGDNGFTQAEASIGIPTERQYLTDPINKMVRAGLLVKTDRVRYRPGSKAPSAVYAITPAGVEAIGGGQ